MESGTSTDYTYSATTDAKTESNVKEPKAPEGTLLRQVQDAKESISVLKNQVSFADQCLSLLHNQMKHASDTLAILQDQVELAQKTVNSLSLGTAAGLTIQNPQATVAPALSTASRSHPSWINPQSGESDEQRVFVHDCEGPKVYTLSKSSISLGNPAVSECSASHDHGQVPCVVHQVPVHCHCPACLSHANVHRVPQPCHPSPHSTTPGTAVGQVSPEMPPAPQTVSAVSSQEVTTDATNNQAKMLHLSPSKSASSHEHDKNSPGDDKSCTKKESVTRSPMAHQLLQVIDVLQTEDDDDGGSAIRSTKTSLASLLHGVSIPQTSPYGHGAFSWQRVSRRNRKQNVSPLKIALSHSLVSPDKQSSVRTVCRDHPELMRVPAPVLASSLEPEFLVVPTSSFSYDSPPTSASDDGGKEETKSCEILLVKKSVTSSSSVTTSCPSVTHTSNDSDAGDGKECGNDGCCTKDKSQPASSPSFVKKHHCDVTADVNGVSVSLSPPRKIFTGTSPLNSDIGTPYNSKMPNSSSHCSTHNRRELIATKVSDSAETVSLSAAVSHLEHAQGKTPVLSTACHVTDSQAPAMAVISLPNDNSANSAQKQTTPTTKKPIILSRRSSRSSEQNIPQGLVVLVPTIEDAKRLIASSGGPSDGHTPVLVPQHMLNEIHSKNTGEQVETHQPLSGKRKHDTLSSPCSVPSKRPTIDSVVID